MIDAEQTKRVGYRTDAVSAQPRTRSAGARRDMTRRTDSSDSGLARQAQRVSSAKRAERERRHRLLRTRRIAALLIASGLFGGCVWGAVALTRLPALRVATVSVEGVEHLSQATVVALAQVGDDAPIIWLPKRSIAKRVMANPWVSHVEVDRDLPDTVRIVVTERAPAVAIDLGGTDIWVVSTDGRWLGQRSAEDSAVPVVRDVEVSRPVAGARVTSPVIRNVIAIVAGLSKELLAETRAITAPSIEKTALITIDDVEVFVGDAQDITKKDRIAREILRTQKNKVVYINVRVVDSPTWRGLDQ